MAAGGAPLPTRFAIWFNQRSGSSHLRDLLDSHPGIYCAQELFFGDESFGRPDAYTRSGCGSVDELLDLLCTPRSDPSFWERLELPQLAAEHAVGLKVKYEQAITYPLVPALRRAGFRLVHVVRNPLAVHASVAALAELKNDAGDANVVAGSVDASRRRVHLDPELAVWEVHRILQAQSYGRFVCRWFPWVEVRYEDLTGAAATQVLHQVTRFLGVAPHEMRSGLQKALPETLEDTIENYAEVRAALERTELGAYVF